jgi:BirA family biotin operon repressor/biotin-[acetyl-CoA-carboxylase] ligase
MSSARAALAHVLAHFEHHAEIASTNDRGMELARDTSISLPALIVAERQTAGRGRGANRWWSADGALTFSLVVDLSTAVPRERWPLAALTAGLAVCDALSPHAGETRLAVKWPNDVYAAGRKLCGILVETPAAPAGRLVIGIGVNINNSFAAAPPDVRARGVSLVELANRPLDVDAVLATIVGELIDLLPTLADSPPEVVARWPAHCLLTGRIVEVETPAGPMIGLCEGIDESGALLLCDELGPRRCVAGTVVRW